MPNIHRRTFAALIAASAFLLAAPPATARSLNDLRASGVVGERFDGFAVIRDAGASSRARDTVDTVNARRQKIYARRAGEQGVSPDQVGRVYARRILGKAPAGTWFLAEDGGWSRK